MTGVTQTDLRKGMPTMTSEKGWKTGDADEFLEDIMTKHVCEWKWTEVEVSSPLGPFTDKYYRCLKCPEKMYGHQAEARLNATERLSAETMRTYLHTEQSVENYDLWTSSLQALREYADILEGKDET